MKKICPPGFSCLVFSLPLRSFWAQGTIESISGPVKDSTGPATPHAAVQVAVQTATGLVRTTTSN